MKTVLYEKGCMMKNFLGIVITLIIWGCTSQQGVSFESLSYKQTLEKALKINKPIMVESFSDG